VGNLCIVSSERYIKHFSKPQYLIILMLFVRLLQLVPKTLQWKLWWRKLTILKQEGVCLNFKQGDRHIRCLIQLDICYLNEHGMGW